MRKHGIRFATGRHAGVLVPLFAMSSARSWGIGEIGDIEPLAAWLHGAGLDILHLLPVNEMAEGQNSPYSPMSAAAIDPIFISVYAVEDFVALGGEAAANGAFRQALASVRSSKTVDYQAVRALKADALRAAFDRFYATEWVKSTPRASSLGGYIARQGWWLDEYALFRALHARHRGRPWTAWEPDLRARAPGAIERAQADLFRDILFRQYLQWIADGQWQAAREQARPVGIFGDLPFTVGGDSADVWARPGNFQFDATVGAPPDALSETGQDWGLPPYRWDVLRASGYGWLRLRTRRCAALYDGYRVDHVVGFYRTYVRPHDGSEPWFMPPGEREQVALGEEVLKVLCDSGAHVIVEDLGTVPEFVRASLARVGVPGYRVLRWEREWRTRGKPFRDPMTYPPTSVAASGTHDTAPMASWWEQAPADERRQVGAIPRLRGRAIDWTATSFTPALRDALLEMLFESGSNLLILPIQDLFGWRDRINVPNTPSDRNWVYRLPWPVDHVAARPEAQERAATLREWAERHGRSGPPSELTDTGRNKQ